MNPDDEARLARCSDTLKAIQEEYIASVDAAIAKLDEIKALLAACQAATANVYTEDTRVLRANAMIELSAEDRAILGPMLDHGPEGNPIRGLICGQATEVYLAGLRAGLERAAKVCNKQWRLAVQGKIDEPNAEDCAAAIRELLKD